jgi:hypothetical protein
MPLVTMIRPVISGVVNAFGVSDSRMTTEPGEPSRPQERCTSISARDRRDTRTTAEIVA